MKLEQFVGEWCVQAAAQVAGRSAPFWYDEFLILGRMAMRCDCGKDGCRGWKMGYLEDYPTDGVRGSRKVWGSAWRRSGS